MILCIYLGMYIRRTKIKSRKDGKSYFTYRLVESVRTGKSVRQNTILNLGRHFPYPREKWPEISARIRDIVNGQMSMFELPAEMEKAAQYYAGLIIQVKGKPERPEEGPRQNGDFQSVDIDSLELTRPRSVGVEHVALQTLRRLRIDKKLDELGLNKHQKNAALGMIVGRMAHPGSELATRTWLVDGSALGELLDYDFEKTSLSRVYRASDMLLKHKKELESFIFARQKSSFGFEETITLYDLTNTYFEGTAKRNKNAAHGRSKEKRTDCPLVTLGLVLDASGFPKRSEVFKGNASEPATMKEMLSNFENKEGAKPSGGVRENLFECPKPLVVMDAGIATEKNVEWLRQNNYRYLVVSRKRRREFSEEDSVEVKRERDYVIRVFRKVDEESGETELYCHSTRKEQKEKAIADRFSSRFEEELKNLDEGLSIKGRLKNYEKVTEKLGRLKQKYSKASKNYEVEVVRHAESPNAKKISWKAKPAENSQDSHPGVYCLRTNWKCSDEAVLFKTYTMLTDLEAVFRSLKSELGLRPVYHHKTDRVTGHLFISVLAYHLVHNIRCRLKRKQIHSSWETLRKELGGQCRITATMNLEDGGVVHVRKTSKPEPMQKVIYDALDINSDPGGVVKMIGSVRQLDIKPVTD